MAEQKRNRNIIYTCGDNMEVPSSIKPGDDVTKHSFSSSICHLRDLLLKDQRIIYIGPVGYEGPSGSHFRLETYAIVNKVHPNHIPNVKTCPLPWVKPLEAPHVSDSSGDP